MFSPFFVVFILFIVVTEKIIALHTTGLSLVFSIFQIHKRNWHNWFQQLCCWRLDAVVTYCGSIHSDDRLSGPVGILFNFLGFSLSFLMKILCLKLSILFSWHVIGLSLLQYLKRIAFVDFYFWYILHFCDFYQILYFWLKTIFLICIF